LGKEGGLWVCGVDFLTNENGQTYSTLTQVGESTSWQQISVGNRSSLAIKVDGSLWGGGLNRNGQLGDGTTEGHHPAVKIGTKNNWEQISVGAGFSFALNVDGRLWASGSNYWGQLGDGTGANDSHDNDKTSFVYIDTNDDWQNVSAGENHALAIKNDGSLWAWGYNSSGQLGDRTFHQIRLLDAASPRKIVFIDSDGDGIPNASDHFPWNVNEQTDTDSDGVGNNSDLDDDNDGIPDEYEIANGLNPLVASDALLDRDGDGIVALDEYLFGSDDNDVNDVPANINFAFYSFEASNCETELSADIAWKNTDSIAYHGNNSCQVAGLENSGAASLTYQNIFNAGYFSFALKISTEEQYDELTINVDGVKIASFSGEQDWVIYRYSITAGLHKISWTYTKDAGDSVGQDAVWIDSIVLPVNTDIDADGISNDIDIDDDGDGYLDLDEIAAGSDPLSNTSLPFDTDGDFISNVTDTDDDNDGVLDVTDTFPLDATESFDADGDTIGNNADTDDDNDGVLDTADAFSLDATESVDTDGDGMGNNADTDDDNDGFADNVEVLKGSDPLSSNSLPTGFKYDHNGDGQSDVLWRNSGSGLNWLWSMNGLAIQSSKAINTINLEWDIAGRGDFDGDGKSDIVWRNNVTGRNWIYLMDGTSIKTSQELNYIVNQDWQIKGVSDLNNDGKADIVWHHQSKGYTWVYLMDGINITTSAKGQTVTDTNWQIVATGDVNGDGNADLIWRHQRSGINYMWLMNGTTVTSQYKLNTVSSSWDIAGTGDINADGTDDIIWRHKGDGRNWAYLMNEGQIGSSKLINSIPDTNWQIKTIADMDGDGSADIFWHNQRYGKTYLYLMDGITIKQAGYSKTISPQWQVMQ
jgi:hypothetical protein